MKAHPILAATLADLATGQDHTRTAEREALPVEGAPWLSLADLHAIAAAAMRNNAERAALIDPREWTDAGRARAYAAALRAGRAWVASGGVGAYVPHWEYAACEALDAAINEVLGGRIGACYLADHGGYTVAVFGTSAAREWGVYRATLPGAHAGDAGPAELARALGETSTDPAYLARLWDAYRAGIVGRAPVLAEAGA